MPGVSYEKGIKIQSLFDVEVPGRTDGIPTGRYRVEYQMRHSGSGG